MYVSISIILAAVGVAFCTLFFTLRNKSERSKRLVLLVLGCFFAVVYIIGIDVYTVFGSTVSLMNDALTMSKLAIAVLALLRWISYAGVIILGVAVFYKKRAFINLSVLVVLPITFLNIIFLKPNLMAISGDKINYLSYSSIRFMVEQALSAVLCLYLLFITCGSVFFGKQHIQSLEAQNGKQPNSPAIPVKKELLSALFWFLFVFFLFIPLWNFQLFFGSTDIEILLLGRIHKYWIYACFIIPVCFYLFLRKKDYETKYLVLVLLSVQAFFQFFGGMIMYRYSFFQTPINNWPLQICNLAMLTIPLSIITKNKPLFYFTLFVNSVAAFAAVIFQDVKTPLLAYSSLKYIAEHVNAFYIPLLALCLKIFTLPQKKDFLYAYIIFSIYFIAALLLNTYAVNFQPDVNYFFMMDDKVASIFGFLRSIRTITLKIDNLFGVPWTFYPVYQFLIYLGMGAMMVIQWGGVVYINRVSREFSFYIQKRNEEKMDLINLKKDLNGRPLNEPLNMGATEMFKITGFSKIYAKSNQKAVDNLKLEVFAGEIFGLLGHNGAGKTTTMKASVGILPITSGKIEVFGYDVARQPLEAKLLIGYVPDNHAIYERITGREYINFVADMYNVKKADRDRILDELLTTLSMGHAIDNQIKTYSHGMKQKVTIMSALIHNPKLWILDEPLTGLDPKSVYEIKECIKKHAQKGNIVILSSHLLDVVEKICHRVGVMQEGRLERIIDLRTDLKEESLEQIYLRLTESKFNELSSSECPHNKLTANKLLSDKGEEYGT